MGRNPSQQATKKSNKLAILETIRRRSSIAQAEIARELRLRASTVSNLSRELQEQGLITASGKGPSGRNGGKRATLLSIAPGFAYFSGMYLHQERIVSHLIDFRGQIQHTEEKAFNPDSPESVIDTVAEEIRHHAEGSSAYRGAGIAVSSIVNARGDVSTSPDFPWAIPDFTRRVIERSGGGYPVRAENDANCAALYTYQQYRQQYRNLLLFLYNHPHRSLGGGLILDGRLYKGSRGEAGEIIHQEKSDIAASFSAYIARIATFFSPDLLVLAGDAPESALADIHRLVSAEISSFPVVLEEEPRLPVTGAASIISHAVTEQLV